MDLKISAITTVDTSPVPSGYIEVSNPDPSGYLRSVKARLADVYRMPTVEFAELGGDGTPWSVPTSCASTGCEWTLFNDSLPTASNYTDTVVLDGYLYCHCGYGMNVFYRMPLSGGSWETLTAAPQQKYGPAIFAANGRVYLAGGYTSAVTDTVHYYTPGTDSWTAAGDLTYECYRDRPCVTNSGYVYIPAYNNSYLNVYNTSSNTSSSVTPSMSLTRYRSLAWDGDDTIYICGGWYASSYRQYLYKYLISDGSITALTNAPTAFASAASSCVGDWLMCPSVLSNNNVTLLYNIKSNSWLSDDYAHHSIRAGCMCQPDDEGAIYMPSGSGILVRRPPTSLNVLEWR